MLHIVSFSALLRPRLVAAGALLLASSPVGAAPRGGAVTSGQATLSQEGRVTNIDQSTERATLEWQAFSIGRGETVNFNQPNASSVTLNRVVGSETSVIEGALNANGQVFLINASGVLFTRGSQVNAGGLVASTLELSDRDFQKGNYAFKGKSQSSVVNRGTLKAERAGYVALIGKLVQNEGIIVATQGTVALASGEKVTLNFSGNSLFSVSVDQGTLNALVENKRAIYADGGQVFLTAKAADELLSAQVNNSGVVQARTLGELTGKIELYAHGGIANIDGTLDASAPDGGNGGFIETSGDTVNIADGASITTVAPRGKSGTWLIDPTDFTIAASGGNMTGSALSNGLSAGNMEVQSSDGSIHVNDAVTWSSNTQLTLNAREDIYVNAPVTATGGSAGLSLSFGGSYHILTPAAYSGAVLNEAGLPVPKRAPPGAKFASITLTGDSASLHINGDPYTLIHSMSELAGATSGHFALAQDLDARAFSSENAGRASVITEFSGTLAGLGHSVSRLTLSTTSNKAGLIGSASDSVIRDLGVVDASIQGNS